MFSFCYSQDVELVRGIVRLTDNGFNPEIGLDKHPVEVLVLNLVLFHNILLILPPIIYGDLVLLIVNVLPLVLLLVS